MFLHILIKGPKDFKKMNPNKFLQVSNTRYIHFRNISEIEIHNNACIIHLIHRNCPCPTGANDRVNIDAESKFYEATKQFVLGKFLQISNTRYINIKSINEIQIHDDLCTIYMTHSNFIPPPAAVPPAAVPPAAAPPAGAMVHCPLHTFVINAESKFYDVVKAFVHA